jgi:glutamyl-tRNA reductase
VHVPLLHPELNDISVRFATFHDASPETRALAAADFGRAEAAERVYLETCHRVELVSVHETSPVLTGRAVRGRAAVKRVFDVVAGFESAVVAEEQVLAQARAAHEVALRQRSSGPVLNELFRRALRFGRRVRSHTLPGTDTSLADRAVRWLNERLPATDAAVAVVGTGEIGRLLARGIATRGHRVTVVSGSAARAEDLARTLPGVGHSIRVGTIDREVLHEHGAVAIAVRGTGSRITRSDLGDSLPWTVDLSAPGAVDGDAATVLGDRLLTLDALGQHAHSVSALDPGTERQLRAEVEAEVDRFGEWLDTRRNADAVALLRTEADAIRQRHLAQLRRRTALSDAQLAAVEATSAAMLAELLHGPSTRLRHGAADAALVRRLFGVDP